MKAKKSLFSILTVALMLSMLLAGCSGGEEASDQNQDQGKDNESTSDNFHATGLPVVDDQITLTAVGSYYQVAGNKWNKKKTIKTIQDKTNVHIDWQLVPNQGWGKKQNLMLASGDLPDIMLDLNLGNITKYGEDGLLIPMEDLIQKYAPHLSKLFEENPRVRRLVTSPDGHIYILPRVSLAPVEISPGNNMWINKKWLERVGMDMPTTTAEFKKVLEAFKKQDANGNGDPNDEIPFSFVYGRSNNGLVGVMFGSFGIVNTRRENVVLQDGKVKYVPIQPEYKKAIKYIHSLYAEGLIDPEVFSQKSSQYVAKLSSDVPRVGVFVGSSPSNKVNNTKTRWNYALVNPPLMGPEGHRIKSSQFYYLNRRAIAITNANEHPKATIRWADQIYATKMSYKLKFGPNGIKQLDNGKWKIVPPKGEYNNTEWKYKESPVNNLAYAMTGEMAKNLVRPDIPHANAYQKRPEFLKRVDKYFKRDQKFPLILYSAEELDNLERYKTDIMDYAETMRARWITKGGIDEQWDDYVAKIKEMGLAEMVKIYQGAYDRWKSY